MTIENVQSMPFSDAPGCPTVALQVGDVVRDGLMSGGPEGIIAKAKVLEIWKDDQNGTFTVFGLKLDSTYLEGLRHPWEISLLEDQEYTIP